MIVLETNRLVLRHVRPDDIEPLASLFADPDVMRFSSGTQSREYTQRWIEAANTPSVRVAGKMGMHLEKTIRMWDRSVCVYVAAKPEHI